MKASAEYAHPYSLASILREKKAIKIVLMQAIIYS